jgi:hypothetical protein
LVARLAVELGRFCIALLDSLSIEKAQAQTELRFCVSLSTRLAEELDLLGFISESPAPCVAPCLAAHWLCLVVWGH